MTHANRNYVLCSSRYAAINNDNCLCANKVPEHEMNEDQCTLPCKGNEKQICGGFGAQSFYITGVEGNLHANLPLFIYLNQNVFHFVLTVAGPPTNLFVLNTSDSSVTIRWQHPESQTESSLDLYVIRAVALQTYATNQVPLPREWVSPKQSNSNFELVNLLPGTKYNVSITSRSNEYGDGGTGSIIAETVIGIPSPEPEQPHVIARNGQQLEVEIPNSVNYNGPINQIHVVVIFVDSELSQSFDEKLLTNYNQAQEDGTSYYIAAELNYEVIGLHIAFVSGNWLILHLNSKLQNRSQRFTVGDGKYYNGYFNAPLPSDRHVHVSMGILSRVGNVMKRRYANVTTHEQHVDDHDHHEMVLAVRPGGTLSYFSISSVFSFIRSAIAS